MTVADTKPISTGAQPERRRPARRWAGRILLLVLAVAVAVPCGVAWRVWQVARTDARPASDAIIVMGAAQYNGTPSEVFSARLRHAAELYHQGVADRIITVGSSMAGDNFTEAGAGKRWLGARRNVPPEQITAVPHGRDTLQSIRAAAGVLHRSGGDSAVVVTDPWHSLRSRAMARDLGIEAATSPAREGNPLVGPIRVELEYVARETLAYLYYTAFRQSIDAEVYSL